MSSNKTNIQGLSTHMDIIVNDIRNIAASVSKDIEKIFGPNDEYHRKKQDTEILINSNKNYAGIIYDIYYDFIIKKESGIMDGFTIGDFEYPSSFTIGINNTKIIVKVSAILCDTYHGIYTCVLVNDAPLKSPFKDYIDFYKKHTRYSSIMNELIRIRSKLVHTK